MMTGQRNENSVLFSLANLQALAKGEGPTPPMDVGISNSSRSMAPNEGSGLIDVRAMAKAMYSSEPPAPAVELSTIGSFASPVLPPVLAVEPPKGWGAMAKIGVVLGSLAAVACAAAIVVISRGSNNVDPTAARLDEIHAEIQKMVAAKTDRTDLSEPRDQPDDTTVAQVPLPDVPGAGGKTDKTHIRGNSADQPGDRDKKVAPKPRKRGKIRGPKRRGKPEESARPGDSVKKPEDTPARPPRDKPIDDLDKLFAVPKAKSDRSTKVSPQLNVPQRLTRPQVKVGMQAVAAKVQRCGQGKGGTVNLKVTIAPSGRVTKAMVAGHHAGTPAGTCAARAVRRAKFPQTKNKLTVTYPFRF
jgi:TonB family protein